VTPSEQKNGDPDTTGWLQTFYQIAHSDTRWAKEQGWKVVNWALLLFGALLGIQQYFVPNVSSFVFPVVDTAVLLIAIFFLLDLHSWASSTRRTAEKIENKIPNVDSILERPDYDKNNRFYLGMQILVVVVAFFLVVMVHLYRCFVAQLPVPRDRLRRRVNRGVKPITPILSSYSQSTPPPA